MIFIGVFTKRTGRLVVKAYSHAISDQSVMSMSAEKHRRVRGEIGLDFDIGIGAVPLFERLHIGGTVTDVLRMRADDDMITLPGKIVQYIRNAAVNDIILLPRRGDEDLLLSCSGQSFDS